MWKLEEKKPLFSRACCKVSADPQERSREFLAATCYRLILVGTSPVFLRITETSCKFLRRWCFTASGRDPWWQVPCLPPVRSLIFTVQPANSCANSTPDSNPCRPDYTVWLLLFSSPSPDSQQYYQKAALEG